MRFFPPQAGPTAVQVDLVALAVLVVCLMLAVPVLVFLAVFVVKYRKGSPADRSRPPHGNFLLEWGWILTPALLGTALFGYGAWTYFGMQSPPPGALELHVIGKQWMWKVQHPEGRIEIDSLHVPTGRPVRLTMISEDVIHSFYLPALRVKQDVLPSRYTTMWFEASEPGEYHLFCAEYCGAEHAQMRGRLVVMDPEQYERWLAEDEAAPDLLRNRGEEATLPLEERGRLLFERLGCVSCHGADSRVPAPRLVGAYGKSVRLESGEIVTVDEDYLRMSILRPQAQIVAGFPGLMPTYEGRLTEEQILALVAYVRSLAAPEPAPDAALPRDSTEHLGPRPIPEGAP